MYTKLDRPLTLQYLAIYTESNPHRQTKGLADKLYSYYTIRFSRYISIIKRSKERL